MPVPSPDKMVGRRQEKASGRKACLIIMTTNIQYASENARAYPVISDAWGSRLAPAKNGQGLPGHGRTRLKKLVHVRVRVGTLNVGSMNGRGREIADLMVRRKFGILCVQETRWKGNKARELGDGCKLLYSGANAQGRNGVGIALSKDLKDSLVSVARRSDRVMSVKLCLNEMINVVCAYAPQVGCEDEEKIAFWEQLDEELRNIPEGEKVIVGGDLNGHVGVNREGIERVHGGWGVGERNEEGERVVDFAVAFDLAICNTFFQKRNAHLITYKSGGRESQIDYILCRRHHLKEIKNCKVINGESVAPQHRVVCVDWEFVSGKKTRPQNVKPKIKWWRLKEEVLRSKFKQKVLGRLSLPENVQEWWRRNSQVILKVGEEILGKTSGKRPPADKESWWWNEEVQKTIKAKKEAKKRWDASGLEYDKNSFKLANKEAKRAVARAKAQAWDQIYETLDTSGGMKDLYKIAKARDKATKDFTQIRQIKDDQGKVLLDEGKIKERWEIYFEKLLNEENPRMVFEDGVPNLGTTTMISREEVENALKKMKTGKATGPDGVPVEAWKCLGQEGVDILLDLMQKIYKQEKMPDQWRDSVVVPIHKGKGDIQDCGNYRGIKLIPHTMKIWEKIIEKRLREETSIGEGQFGFMPGKSTTDAIFVLRQVMEKHREKQKGLHVVFVDLEKAYDRVPRQEIWRCMREKGVPEKYVKIIQDMYKGVRTQVKSAVGLTRHVPVMVGLHQGSALSPYLFNLVMDVMTNSIKEKAPWCMMFADDIVLCSTNREEVEQKLENLRRSLEERGLKISRKKTEYLEFNGNEKEHVKMQGEKLKRVENFNYLGSTVTGDGELDKEIVHRMQAGWMNWRKVSGVLCDRRISAKKKGMIYKSVVRPAMLYGSETWPMKKVQEKRLEVAEMRMLRWICGVTRKDKIRNEKIRGTTKVVEISKKMQERRLQWYGHLMRRDREYVCRRVMSMEVCGKRGRGRPRWRWLDGIKKDLKEKGLTEEETQDRALWRRLVRNVDPT